MAAAPSQPPSQGNRRGNPFYNNNYHHHHHYSHHHHHHNNPSNNANILNGKLDFSTPSYSQSILENLWSHRNENKYCDVDIVIDGETFPSHRIVLAAASKYFDAMFSSNMAEGTQRSITLPNIDPEIFKLILKFIYTGKITITRENVQEVMAVAHRLGIQDVLNACCDFLESEMDISNCVGIYRFAELYSCTHLKLKAKIYVEKHFSEIIDEEEFVELPKDLLKGFLKSEGLSIINEYQLLQALIQWILHDVAERAAFLPELLETIRLPTISVRQLDHLASKCSNESVRKILLEKFAEHKNQMERNQQANENTLVHDVRSLPRIGAQQRLFVIGGYHRKFPPHGVPNNGIMPDDNVYILNTVECTPLHKRAWKSMAPMKVARSGHGTGVIDGLIFVVGGETANSLLDSGEVLDPFDNKWLPIKPMNHPRSMMGSCVLNHHLFVLGGWMGRDVSDTIECYNYRTDTWTMEGKLPSPRFAMGVVAHENKIYVAGGMIAPNQATNQVHRYCPATQQWERLKSLHYYRAYFSMAVLHGLIYAVGGVASSNVYLNQVERYSIEENDWSFVAPMSQSRAGAGAVSYNGALYVVGGRGPHSNDRNHPGTLASIEIYHPETNTWTRNLNLPKSRCEASTVIL